MINHLRHMAVFTKVVDLGSFRLTAKELGLAPSRVSQTISDLESFLGVTLLHRTTRKLSLTKEGNTFYKHVCQISKSAEAGLNDISSLAAEPMGTLKISLPAFLASSHMSSAIAEFAKKFPKITLNLIYSDHIMNIMDEGLDLSIRVGWLEDSSMVARKISESSRLLVAGKEFINRYKTPVHPHDLKNWDWIHFSIRSNTIEFTSATNETVSIIENSRINVNSAWAMSYFATKNLGLAILPEHLALEHIATGKLVHVLPNWTLKPLGYYAVWPNNSRRENLTLMLVRFLVERGLSSDTF
ncbi:LysR family transcriptional regulator [Pseudoalteromonas distincta]|uniref:LysR family transcriptional regulator n=1 Tax=Pseudoalteromonas distincta TaxID=77608 RepID=UPI0030AB4AB3